jgi:uncharacterized membrane protein
MSENSLAKAPRWFVVVAIVALVWNLLGVAAYIMQVSMSTESLAALPEAERALYESMPAWATAAFALAVNGGALGCLLLALKKSLALPVLVISLAAVLVQMFHAFVISNSFEVLGPTGLVMPVLVLVIAVYLVHLARSAKANGWLS